MLHRCSNSLFYIGALLACSVMAMTTGCASGGFKLTRQYAGFVNKQMIVIRIILYLLTGIVFLATLLIDMVIFNTMDFWEGRVSQGTYDFKEGDKTYQARHEVMPETNLKRSTIKIFDKNHTLLQEVVLRETPSGEIEMAIDGKVRSRVRNLLGIPTALIFDERGGIVEDRAIPVNSPSRLLAGY